MSKKKLGRPTKLDVDTMNSANIGFIIIVIVLCLLLTVGVMTVINPDIIDMMEASLAKLFK